MSEFAQKKSVAGNADAWRYIGKSIRNRNKVFVSVIGQVLSLAERRREKKGCDCVTAEIGDPIEN